MIAFAGDRAAIASERLDARLEPLPHVRTADQRIQLALSAGLELSATFRSLVAILARSDVIVHIEDGRCHARLPDGCLLFGAQGGGRRYLRIRVATKQPLPQLLQMIGHELHHATEVAHAPEVVDQATFETFFQRIGETRTLVPPTYETAAGVKAGNTVLAEYKLADAARSALRRAQN